MVKAIKNIEKIPLTLLIAEDDPDDRIMTREAFEENFLLNQMHFVENGEELMSYLHKQGKYADKKKYCQPELILLDLNMPKKDGRETLKEIKAHPDFCRIPVIILTTSHAEEDIIRTYELGVNSFITKPVTFIQFVEVIKTLGKYWFDFVELPPLKIKR
jgi:CheY-like chemotaxis protein